jgi:squalene-hopene/tetraprenyl-beta-curcumene cyclase
LLTTICALLLGAQDVDLRSRLLKTYENAADWLAGQQDDKGAWKMGPPGKEAPSPSYTALIVNALSHAPEPLRAKYKGTVAKGVDFLLSKANKDGSFGEGPSGSFLKTYTTAIALLGLSGVERTGAVADALRGAQAYLKANQLKEGLHRGGMGYGDEKPGEKKTGNLSVTGFAADGLKASGLPQDDEFWKRVVEFVRKCQNSSEVNNDPEYVAALKKAGLSVGDDGGLFYQPSADAKASPAGTKKLADRDVIQSYGAMTYDGLKTYLYAGLPKDSPEVKAAVDWVRKNWTLDVHPGFAFDDVRRSHLRGLYYYYLLMGRALDALGENPFTTFDGKKRDWPAELGEKLLALCRESKMWKNDNAAWYEGDPVLVTSYVLMTADVLLKNLN